VFIYSRTIQSFTQRLKKQAFQILRDECGLIVRSSRIEYNHKLYPLSFAVFENPKKLGFFDPHFYTLAINKIFITTGDTKTIQNLLRHELAHFVLFLKQGFAMEAHGADFRDLCRSFGWGEEVYLATMEQESTDKLGLVEEREKVLAKVRKLFKLAESLNPHEASLATLKANELLLRHNLEGLRESSEQELEEDTYRLAVIELKRKDAKSDALLGILNQFQVQALYSVGQNKTVIEIIGTKMNIEACDYLAKFLWNELEHQLVKARLEHPELSGLKGRNSFFHGVQEGFTEKLQQQKQQTSSSKELMILERKLQEQVHLVYPRLSSIKKSMNFDHLARKIGQQKGHELQLRAGLKERQSPLRLSFFS